MMEITFGQLLKLERERAGLSLRQLASAADLNPGYISRLESDEIIPREDNLLKIADALAKIVDDRDVTREEYRTRLAEGAGRVPVDERAVARIKADFAALLRERGLQPNQIKEAFDVVSVTTMLRILRGDEPLRIFDPDSPDEVDTTLREGEQLVLLSRKRPIAPHKFPAGGRATITVSGSLNAQQQKQLRIIADLVQTIVARPKP
jgi:transcriptional regulator with XRE-family HTH domain